MRIVACLAGLFALAAAADLAPPPPAPIGWETRITPGFDPPIEYVLVYSVYSPEAQSSLVETLKGWGPEAGQVLARLYRDPDWAEHRDQILTLLDKAEAPGVVEFLKEEVNSVISNASGGDHIDYRLVRLLTMLAQRDAATADRIAFDTVDNHACPAIQAAISYLFVRANQANGHACLAKLEAIATTSEDLRLRAEIPRRLAQRAAEVRAQEPMSVVLEREAKESKP